MNTQTVLLLILATILSLGLAIFQYYYKTRKRGKLNLLLATLRFIVFFGALLLLINPKFTKNEYNIEKANLILLVDNSTSAATSKEDIETIISEIEENGPVNDRFNVETYSFGSELKTADSLSFQEKSTNISSALRSINEIYSASNSAIVLLSDGNQTLGQDYEYYGETQNLPIYPVAIGDTTRYEDIAISQVNTNRYAFLRNKYPIEIYLNYEGTMNIEVPLNISINGTTVYRQEVSLSNTDNTKVINTLLDAKSVGIKNIEITIANLPNERNIVNNKKEVAVEVIDEKTNIAIISNVLHPDLGALKKAIESNEQRSVSIEKPGLSTNVLEDINLFILYQPNSSFKTLYDYLDEKGGNVFTITGSHTDWNFLNSVQKRYAKNSYGQTEEISPVLNSAFGIFNIGDFSIQDFPPLISNLGEVILTGPNEVLLSQRIRGVEIDEPLLVLFKDDLEREAVLFGENIWKWRIQSYRNDGDFKNFDDLIGKIILYLSTNKTRERLTVDYNSVYQGSTEAIISATYFDETFVFDENATILLRVKNADTETNLEMPMLLKGRYYEADLSNLAPGNYDFTATVTNENLSNSGRFTILDFDIEKQFLSTDYRKLGRLAQNTEAELYFPSQKGDLLTTLMEDTRFLPIQKSKQNVVSLIDFRILLAIIVAALALEWFIRKYNGLI